MLIGAHQRHQLIATEIKNPILIFVVRSVLHGCGHDKMMDTLTQSYEPTNWTITKHASATVW